MGILGSNELTEDVRNKGLCVNCGACVGQCPCFKTYKGRISMLFPCTIGEGRCYAHCPKTEVDAESLSQAFYGKSYTGSPLGEYRKIVKSRAAGTVAASRKFQNGGTVTALAACALETGMIDAAALTGSDRLIPKPELVSEADRVTEFSSTKYMAAPTVSLLNQAEENGFSNIGIVGTPCQMTAASQIKQNPLNRDDFTDRIALRIGLFCTWAVDTRDFIKLVASYTDSDAITGMDVPPPPAQVLTLTTKNGDVEIPLDRIRDIVPDGCGICPDMTAEFCDVSVGACESDRAYNTLVIRTDKGQALLDRAVEAGMLELADFDEAEFKGLSTAALNKKVRAFKKAIDMDVMKTPEDTEKRGAMIVKQSVLDAII